MRNPILMTTIMGLVVLQACVRIDTVNPPGNESRGVEYLARLLASAGIKHETVESARGRGNLWARHPRYQGRRHPRPAGVPRTASRRQAPWSAGDLRRHVPQCRRLMSHWRLRRAHTPPRRRQRQTIVRHRRAADVAAAAPWVRSAYCPGGR
jgi:hypothetical protein